MRAPRWEPRIKLVAGLKKTIEYFDSLLSERVVLSRPACRCMEAVTLVTAIRAPRQKAECEAAASTDGRGDAGPGSSASRRQRSGRRDDARRQAGIILVFEHLRRRGTTQSTGPGIDLENFTSFDKSDIEGAARIGDRVYWISSHSFNSKGEDKLKRKLFFATRIVLVGGKPSIEGFGSPVKSLRDPLATVAGVKPGELNIEGLAATHQGRAAAGPRIQAASPNRPSLRDS